MDKKIIITGGTGFIGNALTKELLSRGYSVYVLTRNIAGSRQKTAATATAVAWDARSSQGWLEIADGAHAIINLAGENVASGRWTAMKKETIIKSRTQAADAVMEAIQKSAQKPDVLIQASAAGYYGMSLDDKKLDEESPRGKGFLADVTRQWEESSAVTGSLRTRRVVIRTGIVLGSNGGALQKLILPYKFFMGGHMGTGKQYMSWIHIRDLLEAIIYLMENDKLSGAYNLTAPNPVTAREFARSMAATLGRPSWFNIPSFLVKIMLGEMGNEALLAGQRVIPRRLLESGFRFKFTVIDDALRDLLS